jgi:hypothetical protein
MGGGGGGGQAPYSNYFLHIQIFLSMQSHMLRQCLGLPRSSCLTWTTAGITGFKPYTPYSTDVNQYFAGFSPLQQQAQQASANLQAPQQYGAATGLAGASGLGSLGLAGQAAGAGQQFAHASSRPKGNASVTCRHICRT